MGKQYTSDQVTRRRFSPPAVSNSIVCIGPHSIQLRGQQNLTAKLNNSRRRMPRITHGRIGVHRIIRDLHVNWLLEIAIKK